MPDHIIRVNIETHTPGLGDQFADILRSIDGMLIQPRGDTHRPDLLIYEMGEDIESDFQTIDSLLESNTVGDVILTAATMDSVMLLQAMKTGVKEFFSQPVNEEEVRESIERFRERLRQTRGREGVKTGRIINVMGSKGGVGTTSVAVNLAASMAQGESAPSVVLVDLNLLYGEVPLFLSFNPTYDWGTLTKNIARLDATYLTNVLAAPVHGVHILPAPSQMNGYELPNPEVLEHLLGFMRGLFDYIIIDAGQSFNDLSLKSVEISDHILLVSVLSLPCLANTNKLFRSLSDMGYLPRGRIKVIINRYLKNSDITLKDAEDSISEPVFWTVPNDYRTSMAAINQGVPLRAISADAPISKSLMGMAAELAAGDEGDAEKKKKKGWWPFSKK